MLAGKHCLDSVGSCHEEEEGTAASDLRAANSFRICSKCLAALFLPLLPIFHRNNGGSLGGAWLQ